MPNTPRHLERETLRLKAIINLARGRSPREKLPDKGVWADRYEELLDGLEAAMVRIRFRNPRKFTPIALTVLWKEFVSAREDDPRWAWLVKFCRRWAKVRGVDLSGAQVAFGSNQGPSRGGKQPKYDKPLQVAINRIGTLINQPITQAKVKGWLRDNAPDSEHQYTFEPPIPGCDDLYIDGRKLVWKDRDGKERDKALKSLERYVERARNTRS